MATAVSRGDAVRPRADGDRFGQAPLPREDRDAAAAADDDEHHLASDSRVVFTAALRSPKGADGVAPGERPPSAMTEPYGESPPQPPRAG
jgi:hypothetical protein